MNTMKKRVLWITAVAALFITASGCASAPQAASPSAGAQTANNTTSSAAQQSQTASASQIDEAAAQQIALEHAGVAESDTSFLMTKLDYDDGIAVYDVEFYVSATNSEYDYEIDAASGEIRSYDQDAENYQPGAPQTNAPSTDTAGTLTEEEIRNIALARVSGATESDIRMRQEIDDGRSVYEGSILYDGFEYDFEIDAATGDILSWESESVFD